MRFKVLQDLYCKIYIDTDLSEEELIKSIEMTTGSSVSIRTIKTNLMEIDVVVNSDSDSNLKLDEQGFVYYPYYLEIDPTRLGQISVEVYITSISSLLNFLWTVGQDAVPACGYEDMLPRKDKPL
jgi:hypothetical protein